MSLFASAALCGLASAATLAFLTWLASLARRDVSLVDRMWSLMIAAPALVYAAVWPAAEARTACMLAVLLPWALRLAVYVSWRNWGHGEDRRYQAIRERHQPGFALKSLYLVFALQAVLAWLVALPLLAAFSAAGKGWTWGVFDSTGLLLAAVGLAFETVGDAQLARFKARPENRGRVMDRGLWRYTRHPNYFGECCVWWGLFLMAFSAGGWWSVVSPLLMTVLLLKVSGVSLLEQDIGERRPGYFDYKRRTNAFLPGRPKEGAP